MNNQTVASEISKIMRPFVREFNHELGRPVFRRKLSPTETEQLFMQLSDLREQLLQET